MITVYEWMQYTIYRKQTMWHIAHYRYKTGKFVWRVIHWVRYWVNDNNIIELFLRQLKLSVLLSNEHHILFHMSAWRVIANQAAIPSLEMSSWSTFVSSTTRGKAMAKYGIHLGKIISKLIIILNINFSKLIPFSEH